MNQHYLSNAEWYVADVEPPRLATDCAASKWNIGAGQVNAWSLHWRQRQGRTCTNSSLCAQLPMSADNVTLLASAAEHRPCNNGPISPGCWVHGSSMQRLDDETDGRMDRRSTVSQAMLHILREQCEQVLSHLSTMSDYFSTKNFSKVLDQSLIQTYNLVLHQSSY